MLTTRSQFLAMYREILPVEYPWARDPARLDRFMESVARTINTQAATWNHDSGVARKAFKAIGGTGPYSRKALRELPL